MTPKGVGDVERFLMLLDVTSNASRRLTAPRLFAL